MITIEGYPKKLQDVLQNKNYSINYYQREYNWGREQIQDMIEDLTSEFLNSYKEGDSRKDVLKYGVYFMGTIVVSNHENAIIDGQQRLSSLTLLLIYLNNRLKKLGENRNVNLEQMICSEKFGLKNFNINVEDRKECMEALFNDKNWESENAGTSALELYGRYSDIEDLFPRSKIPDDILLNFCDWLEEKVQFIVIVAQTDQDAHNVFVTLNDRGLNLTSTEMLKGFLLSKVENKDKRRYLSDLWKEIVLRLKNVSDKEDEIFIKAWLRSQFAETIRDPKKDSENKDFDLIGGSFHKWVRDNSSQLGLINSRDYENFLEKLFWFAERYLDIIKYQNIFNKDYPYIYYNAKLQFTHQPMLLMAALNYNDCQEIIKEKLNLVSRFIDLYIVRRIINYKTVNYSSIKNYIFSLVKSIRRKNVNELKPLLLKNYEKIALPSFEEALPSFGVNGFTNKYIRHFLARILDWLERKSDIDSKYEEYIKNSCRNPYEIEHILCDHYELYVDSFDDPEDFRIWRSNIGNLLLLKKSINASLQDAHYSDKLEAYSGAEKGNYLSASLDESLYNNNPRFVSLIKKEDLNFSPFSSFGKKEIKARNLLYVKLFNKIWNKNDFITIETSN